MSRYYFDIENGHPYRDDVGEDLPDDEAAWRTAIWLTRDMESNLLPGGAWNLEVRDRRQKPIFRITVKAERLR
ncbi:DUF6894 family protein [Bradyrhizobium liaoningense]|uniref:DUF6894 family protein n=1 Tax=Bradyrhizobium liaoningense TaxID=43992 RepID=UPI003908B5CA